MRKGEAKAALLTSAIIALIGSIIASVYIGSGWLKVLIFTAVASSVLVGLPALFGIVAVQTPIARFVRWRGGSIGTQACATCLANIVLTITLYSVGTEHNALSTPNEPYILASAKVGAALLWFVLDLNFTRNNNVDE